jgi:hypothetical protein
MESKYTDALMLLLLFLYKVDVGCVDGCFFSIVTLMATPLVFGDYS